MMSKRCFLVAVLCHMTVLFVTGQETTITSTAAKLNNDDVKGDAAEATTTVGGNTAVTSEGLSTTKSPSTTSETDKSTKEPTAQTTGTASLQTSKKISTSTEEDNKQTTTSKLQDSTANDRTTNQAPTVADSKTSINETAVNTTNTIADNTVTTSTTNNTAEDTVTVKTFDISENLTTSSVGVESSSTQSNLDSKISTVEPKQGNLTPSTEKAIESTKVTETVATTEPSEEQNTDVAGITSQIHLSCKNYSIKAFKPGHVTLPCSIRTTADIDCNETALIWGNDKNSVTCGNTNYGVGLKIEDNSGTRNYTGDISFSDEADLEGEIKMTIKVVLENNEEKEANFKIEFIGR
ncbi:DgyrCDS9364 [Dimorphilus gyrociliatus]|uniref:DgyrCDS9364 n=1 Tax=Dimorphilus gyrociliatus TaxID=2664684 RepID=A0A7I8VY35_9ANNE|nr:DgyrCDS9364 [Dimorphilus gyrociliatus]